MSRCYEMRVTIRGFRPERVLAICGALHTQWDFDPSRFPAKEDPVPEELDVTGVDYLGGGMTEDEFAARLAQAAWAANDAYCEVEVQSLYLDACPPSTHYAWSDGDYQAWKATPAA